MTRSNGPRHALAHRSDSTTSVLLGAGELGPSLTFPPGDDRAGARQVPLDERDPAVGCPEDVAVDPVVTLRLRLVLFFTTYLSVEIGVLGRLLDIGVLSWTGILVFSILGVGSAPWQWHRTLGHLKRIAVSLTTGLTVVTVGGVVMLGAGQWRPIWLAVAVILATLVVHGAHARLAFREARDLPPLWTRDLLMPSDPRTVISLALSAGGIVLVLGACATHRRLGPAMWGFLPRIGPVWYLGLAAILAAVVVGSRLKQRAAGAASYALMLAFTLTPALVYGVPHSQSAAKHVDLIMQIRELHRLDSTVAVYNDWSGFFAGMAWLCDMAALPDPMQLATFWPPIIGLFRVTALRYLFGRFCGSGSRAWLATSIAVLADPIGADYFSPQSVGFVIAIVIFALALDHSKTGLNQVVMAAGGVTIAMTHQLTPYIVSGVLILLVLTRQTRAWWTPVLTLVPAAGWALLHLSSISGFINIGEIGKSQNFKPPSTPSVPGLTREPVVAITSAALLAGVLVIGALAALAVLRFRRSVRAWAIASLPGVGLAVIAANAYGNEGIFRATLFGIPWLAGLAAWTLTRGVAVRQVTPARGTPARGTPPPRRVDRGRLIRPRSLLTPAVVVTLSATFLIASFGLDDINVVRSSDLVALEVYLEADQPARSRASYLLNVGPGDLPSSGPARRADGHNLLALGDLYISDLMAFMQLPADTQLDIMTQRLIMYGSSAGTDTALYAMWSQTSSDYSAAYALQPRSKMDDLRRAFRDSPDWKVVYDAPGTTLFMYAGNKASQ